MSLVLSTMEKPGKAILLDVYVTGPFNNGKTGKSHFVVIFGAFLKAWPLMDSFLRGYLHTLATKMNSVKVSKIDTNHCHLFTEINIRKHEFGKESEWRRLAPKNGKSENTIKKNVFHCILRYQTREQGFSHHQRCHQLSNLLNEEA